MDYVRTDGRAPVAPLAGQLLLMTGALPVAILFAWRSVSVAGRVLFLAGAAYLVVIFFGSQKNLHYLAPLPWMFLVPALEASTKRWRLAAVGGPVLTFVLSWPGAPAVRRDGIELGRESCIQDLDYEAAALAADPIYDAFDQTPRSRRFAIGKHTLVRYALDLGGRDCVFGLSARLPPGAIQIAGGAIKVWTTDPERYATWRFRQITPPSSRLFRRPVQPAYPTASAAWPGRLDLTLEPARALLLSSVGEQGAAHTLSSVNPVRLLVPVPDARYGVTLGLRVPSAVRLELSANGAAPSVLSLRGGERSVGVPATWRAGWNVLEIGGGDDVGLQWVEARLDPSLSPK